MSASVSTGAVSDFVEDLEKGKKKKKKYKQVFMTCKPLFPLSFNNTTFTVIFSQLICRHWQLDLCHTEPRSPPSQARRQNLGEFISMHWK